MCTCNTSRCTNRRERASTRRRIAHNKTHLDKRPLRDHDTQQQDKPLVKQRVSTLERAVAQSRSSSTVRLQMFLAARRSQLMLWRGSRQLLARVQTTHISVPRRHLASVASMDASSKQLAFIVTFGRN